ncbi:MAG: TolC family protein [Pseudomonadota bacterium]|nr:TolC family protein [Pseudomonadota bacterium]
MVLLALVARALAEPPSDLEELVGLALERDPEAAAAALDARAATEDARAAGRPMNPMLMMGGDSLGAMPEDPDPTMYMVGVEQMLRGWGEARASADRARVDVTRAEADRARVAADLRLRLAQAAARIRAFQAERTLLDQQIRAAETLWQAGVRRWGAGAGRPGMGGMGGSEMDEGMEAGPSSTPPAVKGGGGGGGGRGMPGMGDGAGGGGRAQAPAGGMEGDTGMGGGGTGGMDPGAGGMGGGSTLPDLLRVEAEVARLRADRAALDARLAGETAVLTRFVGDEAAAAVHAVPEAYLEEPSFTPSRPPEIDLVSADRAAAEADLRVARSRIAPDVELGASVGIMPDGMVQGVNVMVGVEMPLWGANARSRDAASARVEAATRRADGIDRDLAAATDAARAAETAATARSGVLREVAVPRAESAWKAALARYAAGQTGVEEALRAWEGLLAAQRDLVAAERDQALRAAERVRVEIR